ncbi:DUF5677 domain-containing protein [Actinomadura meyerae]|uniref:DUF5677 domain-containing protein n=1 Tax=Actinomadura meyerae TaxID=240840 RepID=UPI0011775B77|nr:DUF5677 domain-containing protein [Actinomadura meyerae]
MDHHENDPSSVDAIEAAEEFAQVVEVLTTPYLGAVWERDLPNRRKLASIVCIKRQLEAIRSGMLLAKNNLGHMGAVFLRPACEEAMWLSYLHKIDEEDANRLLSSMTALDVTRSIIAQQQYAGKRGMRSLGFPANIAKHAGEGKRFAEEELQEFGRHLGWPKDDSDSYIAPPPVAWIAQQCNMAKLYDFLYSATSRSVHFSAGEVSRRGWAYLDEEGEEHEMDFLPDVYHTYRTDFSLYWCCSLLVETLAAALPTLMPEEIGDDVEQRMLQAVKKVGAIGVVPIIVPSEFNIPQMRRRIEETITRAREIQRRARERGDL